MLKTKEVQKNKERGITLVALVVTIIALLILAGISINGIFGESGIINNAQKAKEEAEIAEETEIVAQANIIAEGENLTGDIKASDIEDAIDKVGIKNNTTVMEDENCIVVKFNESNRYYTIDDKGAVAGPIEKTEDEHAGDISKGKTDAGKSAENPFVINCIEDLVAFSIMAGGGRSELGLASNQFANQYVILARTLDFKSMFSYNDHTTKIYGDLNGDGTTDNIKTELTKQGDTCGGFTPIATFKGTFDGQGNKICNLYENRGTSNAGLFEVNNGTIQNLGLKNITLIGTTNIGGVAARSITGNIINCSVEGKSIITLNGTSSAYLGLICGYSNNIISECYSIGELKLNATVGKFGGIVGENASTVEKSYNIMDIKGGSAVGGIAGNHWGGTIEECFHIGNIEEVGWKAGGIAGSSVAARTDIINCYNIGNITAGENAGGIVAYSGSSCFNCYSIGKAKNKAIIGGQYGGKMAIHCFARRGDMDTYADDIVLTPAQVLAIVGGTNGDSCEVIFDEEFKEEAIITKLNNLIFIDSEGTRTETPQTVWKMDTEGINNGYPIFTWQKKIETE